MVALIQKPVDPANVFQALANFRVRLHSSDSLYSKTELRTVVCYDPSSCRKVKEIKSYFPHGMADYFNHRKIYKAYVLPRWLEDQGI